MILNSLNDAIYFRDSLATDLIALHFLNDDRVCKDGEIFQDNKICIINGRSQSLLFQKKGLTRKEEDLMKVGEKVKWFDFNQTSCQGPDQIKIAFKFDSKIYTGTIYYKH